MPFQSSQQRTLQNNPNQHSQPLQPANSGSKQGDIQAAKPPEQAPAKPAMTEDQINWKREYDMVWGKSDHPSGIGSIPT